MDITIQREALLKPLQAVSGVVEKKQTLPILSNVLLTIRDNRLLLIGTDLEIELVGFVTLESMTSQGSITVSARKLFDICRTLPEGVMVRLSIEKNYLVVRAGESCFMLNTLPAEEFPSLEDTHYSVQFNLKQTHLKNLLNKTYFAMGQQDVRHYLNGAFLDINQHSIKCVAADGHRLALSSIQDESIGEAQAKVILPRKSVLELIRLLGSDNEEDVTIHIGESRFRVMSSDYIFTSKLINAQYPDYNRLIPKGTMSAVGDREVIKQALVRASILSNEKFRGVRFQFEPSKLLITANNSDQEQAEEAMSLEYAGNKTEIGFNVAYWLDVVSTITTKCIRCVFTDSNSGVLIEPVEGEYSIYVVMPMRL
ncbi:MAG: DNA polymerase III subunit beta [Gammaproteobacteria bacterium]|nr:MAG: DNA polymerase III subunit beta [Gammaproteobacteria bacterium]